LLSGFTIFFCGLRGIQTPAALSAKPGQTFHKLSGLNDAIEQNQLSWMADGAVGETLSQT
jgi:hypothetical protein